MVDLFLTHSCGRDGFLFSSFSRTCLALPPLRCTTQCPHNLLPVGAFSASVTHARAAGPLSCLLFVFRRAVQSPRVWMVHPTTCWTNPIQPGAHCHRQTSTVSLDEYPVDGHGAGAGTDTATIPLRHDKDTLLPLLVMAVMAVMAWSRDVHAVRPGCPARWHSALESETGLRRQHHHRADRAHRAEKDGYTARHLEPAASSQ